MTVLPQTRAQLMEAAAREASQRRWRRPAVRLGRLGRLGRLVPAASAALAVLVAGIALTLHAAGTGGRAPAGPGGAELILQVRSLTRSEPVTAALVRREAAILRARLQLELPVRTRVAVAGGDRLAVSSTASVPELEALIAAPPRLRLFDWEANVLLPDGHTAASELAHGPTEIASLVSQGLNSSPPGYPAAGALDLYAAVRLAAAQPPSSIGAEKPIGDQYYLFGRGKDAACGAVGSGSHCLLAGPIAVPRGTPRSRAIAELEAPLPAAARAGGEVLVVKPGTIVLAATAASWPDGPAFGSPDASYFVLRDRVGVPWTEITDPRPSTGADGVPDITFSFTPTGARSFQRVTAAVAQRGSLLSVGPRSMLDQHFAVVVGNRIMSVPLIDFRLYPDGVTASGGADISGNFTRATTRRLAAVIALPQLPLDLVPVSVG